MKRNLSIALLAGALSLAACQQEASQPGEQQLDAGTASVSPSTPGHTSLPTPAPAPTTSAPTVTRPAVVAGENDGSPNIAPAPLSPEAAKTVKGARAILLSWARGIELREFDQAWALMGEAGRAQRSKAEFNALFHPLKEITVAIPDGTTEGAAGSIYYTVPTTVSGTRADGTKAVLKGEVVMRRVNDVDGATQAQLTWHIVSVDLKPV